MADIDPRADWVKDLQVEDALECPVCLKLIMDAPIYVCENNHPLCDVCRDQLKGRNSPCPVCRGSLTEKRSWSLEKLIGGLKQTSCAFSTYGCDYKKVNIARVQSHQEDCQHRRLPCYYCDEKIPLSGMATHLSDNHSAITRNNHKVEFRNNAVKIWCPTSYWNLKSGTTSVFKVNRWKSITFFLNMLVVDSRYLLIWVTHSGSRHDKAVYRFTFKLHCGKAIDDQKVADEIVKYSEFCLPMDTELKTIRDEMLQTIVLPTAFVDKHTTSLNFFSCNLDIQKA